MNTKEGEMVTVELERSDAETFASTGSVATEPQAFAYEAAQQRIKSALRTALEAPPRSPGVSEGLQDGAALITAERRRQVEAEGWTREHDDDHADRSLVAAAVCYAKRSTHWGLEKTFPPDDWPWEKEAWKPQSTATPEGFRITTDDEIRNLTKAGALIAAEIDRLQRSNPRAALLEEAQPSPEPNRIEELEALGPGWDSYDGVPPTKEALKRLKGFDRALASEGSGAAPEPCEFTHNTEPCELPAGHPGRHRRMVGKRAIRWWAGPDPAPGTATSSVPEERE